MKKLMILSLLALMACTTQEVTPSRNAQDASITVLAPTLPVIVVPVVKTPSKYTKTLKLTLPPGAYQSMVEAQKIFNEHSNSDAFYSFFSGSATVLKGGNATSLPESITKFRECLNKGDTVKIEWKTYAPLSRAIGGWHMGKMLQNSKKVLTPTQRAGHWIHELSHKCGFTHVSNNIVKHPIIKNSFPYQLGYLFEDYAIMKQRATLAGAE